MATGTVLTPATLPLQGLKVNFGNIEGFEIQTDSGRGSGGPLVTQAFATAAVDCREIVFWLQSSILCAFYSNPYLRPNTHSGKNGCYFISEEDHESLSKVRQSFVTRACDR
jgi:hypothetical protein